MRVAPPYSSYEVPDVTNGTVPTTPILSKREKRLDKAMAYFSSKILLVQIILACVFGATELNYGIKYRGQCPMEPLINTFLIVHGATKIAWVILNILAFINAKVIYGVMHQTTLARQLMLPNIVLQLVFTLWFFAWFIAGNVWVFSTKNRRQSTNTADTITYCQERLYKAASGLIISTYIIGGIVIILTIKRRVIGKKIKNVAANVSDNDDQSEGRF